MKKKIIIICLIVVVVLLVVGWFFYPSFENDHERNCQTYGVNYQEYRSIDKINGSYRRLCCTENGNCIGDN